MSNFFNQTNSTNFLLQIPDGKLTESFVLNLQTINVPEIHIPSTYAPAGTQGIATGSYPGSGIEFEPLNARFIVDENLDSWLSMYKWMISINNYIDRDRSGWMHGDKPRPVVLNILNNTKTDVVLTIRLHGAWCSNLSEIEYDYTVETDPALFCVATINYQYLEVEKDGAVITGRV